MKPAVPPPMSTRLCGKYLGDNDGTCPQLTCIRRGGHEGLCDNVRGDDAPKAPSMREMFRMFEAAPPDWQTAHMHDAKIKP